MSSAPSMSLIESGAGVGVGNYKGVMLCNRPFGGSTATANVGPAGSTKTQFTCGVVPETIGLNVPIGMKSKVTKRPVKDNVLSKHKKWLHDLQKTKDRLEAQYVEDYKRKEEEKIKFQEHEKQMREVTLSMLNSTSSTSDAKADSKEDRASSASNNNNSPSYPESKGYTEEELRSAQPKSSTSYAADSKKSQSKSSAQAKPAWAMTEKAAEEAADDLEFAEADELINFAKGLDADKYLADVEIKTMMERLRKRIIEYEREIAEDDARETDAENRAAKREMLRMMGETEHSLQSEEYAKMSDENIAMTAAKALLQDEEDLQAVHSTKSAAVLLKQAKDKISAVKDSVRKPGAPAEAKVLNEPIIVTHNSEDTARLELKNSVDKLAYMHRNPAV